MIIPFIANKKKPPDLSRGLGGGSNSEIFKI